MKTVNPIKRDVSGAGAPALEKGLDLLEALADEPIGLTQKAIADRVGRSVGEIFRMLGALEQRGYVLRDPLSGQYRLTLRLFELAHRHPPTRLLLQAATGEMDRLANAIDQSCHLVSLHGSRILVIAESQPEQQAMGWSVRIGAGFPISSKYASARVLAAFQKPERRETFVNLMALEDNGRSSSELDATLTAIAAKGFDIANSETAQGVTDVSFPVLDHFGQAIAAITVAVVVKPSGDVRPDTVVAPLRLAAKAISTVIGGAVVTRGLITTTNDS